MPTGKHPATARHVHAPAPVSGRPGVPDVSGVSHRTMVGRLWAFGGVSGIGWCLDLVVFTLLVYGAGLAAGPANAVSAGLAVAFVFLVTHERLFRGRRAQRRRNLVLYAGAQVLLVAGAAWLVGTLVDLLGVEPLVVKIGVTPLTFAANFAVLSAITLAARSTPVPAPTPSA